MSRDPSPTAPASGTSAISGSRERRGFTILELVVALALSGVVAVVAFASVHVATDAAARLRGAQRTALAGLTTRATLEGWLHAATVLPGAAPFVGIPRSGLDLRRDELSFAVLEGGPLYPGAHHIHLRVDHDPGTPVRGLVAEIAPLRGVGGVDTLELAPSVAGLRVRYRGSAATRSPWSDAWQSDREVPSVVELRLLTDPNESTSSALLDVPLVVAIGWEGR